MSEDTPTADSAGALRSMPWNRWLTVLVGLILASVAAALILPAIQQAREAASRTQTKQNLSMIGLSLWNYYDVHRVFPPGGVVDADGRGHHGWTYQIMPFVDQNTFTHDVDPLVPWDTNINRHRYRLSLEFYRVPGVTPVVTTDGFPVTHFMANPAVLFRNSSTSYSAFENGASNAWLLGEAGGNYQPWGYPFNWREKASPLNESADSFGRPGETGAHFLRGDGSVRYYSDRATSTQRMPAEMLVNPPLPDESLRERPHRKFNLTDYSGLPTRKANYIYGGSMHESLAVETIVLSDGRLEFLEIRGNYKVGFDPPTFEQLRKAVTTYPNVEGILLPVQLDDQVAELLATLRELTHVYASSVSLSEHGAKTLCGIQSLQVLLVEDVDDESAAHIAQCEPAFEIRRGRIR